MSNRIRKYLPQGPCLVCGGPTYNAAHRLIDAIRDRHRAGDSIASLSRDYEIPRDIVAFFARSPIGELDRFRRYRRKDAIARMEREISKAFPVNPS